MSRLVARILLSIFMFPLAGILYILQMVIGMSLMRHSMYYRDQETILFGASGLVTWALVAIYWCLLWRSSVRWSRDRILFTVLAAIGAGFAAAAVGGIADAIMGNGDGLGFGVFIAGVLAMVLWLIATVFIWRETAAERAQRLAGSTASAVTCPTCGYNLTGLRDTRCPECGTQFTIDELVASLPNNKVEIE